MFLITVRHLNASRKSGNDPRFPFRRDEEFVLTPHESRLYFHASAASIPPEGTASCLFLKGNWSAIATPVSLATILHTAIRESEAISQMVLDHNSAGTAEISSCSEKLPDRKFLSFARYRECNSEMNMRFRYAEGAAGKAVKREPDRFLELATCALMCAASALLEAYTRTLAEITCKNTPFSRSCTRNRRPNVRRLIREAGVCSLRAS